MEYIIGLIAGLILGGGLIFAYFTFAATSALKRAKTEAVQLRENAVKEA